MTNSSPLLSNFSIALNYYRTLRKKSIKDISEALQLPASTISSWNTGRHLPDMDRLQRLAEYLNAPIEQFFNFSPEAPRDSELIALHNKLDTDSDALNFLKLYVSLPEEDKRLLTLLAFKIVK
jgi:transcriptional regulator with XRE-family HTH domain